MNMILERIDDMSNDSRNMIISVFMGIICGIVIGFFLPFRSVKTHGPDSNIIRNQVYKVGNKCYQFTPQVVICPIK